MQKTDAIPIEKQNRARTVAATFPTVLADAVRVRRQELGLTQEGLAIVLQNMGIQATQGYLSLLESGQRTDPNMRLIVALAVILDISLDKLTRDCGSRGNP